MTNRGIYTKIDGILVPAATVPGPKGDTGLTGNTGLQGGQGIQGPAGGTGPQGPQGLPGAGAGVWQGEWDVLFDYASGDVVSYEGSTWLAVTNPPVGAVPMELSAYWGLMAAKGDEGEQGIQGDQGIQGEQGYGVKLLDHGEVISGVIPDKTVIYERLT